MGGISGTIAGLIGSAQGEKSIDMAPLLATIQNAGAYQQQIINALPPEIQKNLATYAASQGVNLATLTGQVQGQAADYTQKMGQIYGPNSDAANAEKLADKQSIYSTVPGSQDAIRNAMAATGGLARGNAGASLAQPYIQAAGQYGQAAAGVNAKQGQLAQGATEKALGVVNSMEANLFQTQFGMSKEQAAQILQTGNDALKQQLSQLLLQSANQTNQTLGVQGIQAQNAYQNALQQQSNQGAVWNGLANMGAQGLSNVNYGDLFKGGGAAGSSAGLDAGTSTLGPEALALA